MLLAPDYTKLPCSKLPDPGVITPALIEVVFIWIKRSDIFDHVSY